MRKIGLILFALGFSVASAQVTPSQECAECHKDIYNEWSSSRHAVSTVATNPFFSRMYQLAKNSNEAAASRCLSCHEPVRDLLAGKEEDATVQEGIACDVCHATEMARGASNWHKPAPENLKYGPLADALASVHESEYSAYISKSAFCMTCHSNEENAHGVGFCSTLSEWQASSFAKKGVQCQDCHMPGVEGKVAPLGKLRYKVHSHAFYGGYSPEMLRNCAKIDLKAEPAESHINLHVEVKNHSVGHALPTGSPMRMVILKVEVRDGADKVIWENYRLNPLEEDPDAVFMKLLQDENGNAPVPPWEAVSEKFDQRLMPDEPRIFDYAIPNTARTVEATLIYRLAPPPLLEKLGLDREPWNKTTIINRKRLEL